MIEKTTEYPAYQADDETILTRKVMLSLTFQQVMEIANVFYYFNKLADKKKFFRSLIPMTENQRAIHKSVHDAAVNCAISLEEYHRIEKSGGRHE